MRPPLLIRPGTHVDRLAPGELSRTREWASALASMQPVRTLKEDGTTLVLRARVLSRDVVVKRWDLVTLLSRLKSLAGISRAFRQWHGAQWLSALDIPTARCLALITESRDGRVRQFLVMEALNGPSLLDCLASPLLSPRQEHRLARAIARQLVTLTLAGRYNRDHKPSNLIVLRADTPDPVPAIIDTVAINKLRPWRRADLYAMFASLVIEPIGCGRPPRRSLMMRVLVEHQRELLRRIPGLLPDGSAARRAARHLDWMRIAGLIDAHGDPTPRINPLSNP